MIDLSFLTEEEQDTIMKVLQRDAVLKRAEEERVRHLPEKVKDDQQLKNMSGQWFYEAKARRHKDRIHGADIIRASMRKKRPQVAVSAEQSKDRAMRAKESWANSVNKAAFLPPELAGVGEEPEDKAAPGSPSSGVVNPVFPVIDVSQENTRKPTVSPSKQRKNPFNSSKLSEDCLSQRTKYEHSENGRAGLLQISEDGELTESEEKTPTSDPSSQELEKTKQSLPPGAASGAHVKAPIPKARKLIPKSNDLKQGDSQSFSRPRTDFLSARGAPRGILKRNSSSSSTDSETLRLNLTLDPKSRAVSPGLTIHERISEQEQPPDDSSLNSLEPLKHVRFSAMKDELPQSPRLSCGREVGEFHVLECDPLKNGTEEAGNGDEILDDSKSLHRKPLSPSSSSESENKTHQPVTSSSVPNNGLHLPSEIPSARPSVENLAIIKEHQDKAPELTRRDSEVSNSPADELSPRIEPEPAQTPGHGFRDHQQGKPLLVPPNAKTSSCSGPDAFETRKTADDSISKVLDWFKRSSLLEDSKSPRQHLQGTDLRPKAASESQVTVAVVTDDTCLKEDVSKAPPSRKVKLKAGSTFQEEGDALISETYRGDSVKMNLSQQGTPKEGPDILQPFENSGTPFQGSKNMDQSHDPASAGEGRKTPLPNSNCALTALTVSAAEARVPRSTQHTGSLDEDKRQLQVPENNRRKSQVKVDPSVSVQESNLKDKEEAERKSKDGNPSLEAETGKLAPRAANSGCLWKKSEVQPQQGVREGPENHVHREKYRRVSDRISFWEGEKAGAQLTGKQLRPSRSQEQSSGKMLQSMGSLDTSVGHLAQGQNERSRVSAKRVVLEEDDQTFPFSLSSFRSSNKPKETRPPILSPSENCPPSDQSDKVTLFQNKMNEHTKRSPVEDVLHSRKESALPVLQYAPDTGDEINTSSEKDRFVMGQPNANIKVISLKERLDEPNTEQVYSHSQFENLRKFWDQGTNPNDKGNYEKNASISQRKFLSFTNQKSKEPGDIKSLGNNSHEVETFSSQKNIMTREEREKLNPEHALQGLANETTLPLKPQLLGNEPSKDTAGLVAPGTREGKDESDEEIQESIVEPSVLSKDHKDSLSDGLQKLLLEGLSLATQPPDGKPHGEQVFRAGVSENKMWAPKKDFTNHGEGAAGWKESCKKHVDKAAACPEFGPSISVAGLHSLWEETPRASPFHSQEAVLASAITRTTRQSEDGRLLGKGIKQSHGLSVDQRKITAPSPEENGILENAGLAQKADSFECSPSPDCELLLAVGGCPPVTRPSPSCSEGASLEEVTSSPPDRFFSTDAHLGPQKGASLSPIEISEIVEKVILPSKSAFVDVNATLQRLLREAGLSHPVGREAGHGEVGVEFPEVPAAGGSPIPPGVILQPATSNIVPNRKDLDSIPGGPEAEAVEPSPSASGYPSERLMSPAASAAAQGGQELPQEVAELAKETIIQSKSEWHNFEAGLEKLLKGTLETSPPKFENQTGTVSPPKIISSSDMARQAVSKFHPKEIQEHVEKAEAPSITESTFDSGFQKLLKEITEAPPSHGLESQLNPCDKLWEGGEVMSNQPTAVCGYARGAEVFLADPKVKMIKSERPPEAKDCESYVAREPRAFQKPDFEETPEEISALRNKQPIPPLANQENTTKIKNIEGIPPTPCKRQDNEQEMEGPSESECSDANTGSNAESWTNASSSEEEPRPVLKALERSAARIMPSKSLEDISSDPSNQAKVDTLPEELVLSAEDDKEADQQADTNECRPGISTAPSLLDGQFSHADNIRRMSKSVPAFLQDESDDRETDTASESSYQLRRYKKSPSSLTNLSSSSGMTSLSSVSGSVMSVYSGDFGNLEVKGNIQFAVDYVESLKELHVFVAQCKDLAAADVKKQRSDPYVKTYLLPDKGKMGKKKTVVVKKTLNPVYNEILRYKIEKQLLKTQKLNVSVWHRDTFKRNSFLGEVELDLKDWDWDSKQSKQLKWYPLKRKTAPIALETENRGEMKLALQYVPQPTPGKKLPTTGEVHIWVKECLDLPLLRGSHLNSFVKCTILPDTSRKSRQKTRAVGKTTNPIFNHTMVYDGFRPEDLMEACVELTVWDHYKLTNQFLGGLRIGYGTGKSYGTEVDWMDSTSEEVALWEKMVNSPNTWIEATLPLRMLLIAKIAK